MASRDGNHADEMEMLIHQARETLATAMQHMPTDEKLIELSNRLERIKSLPTSTPHLVMAAEVKTLDECCICLEEQIDPVLLACGHSNCRACIELLRKEGVSDTCPMCRSKLEGPDELYVCANVLRARYERLLTVGMAKDASAVLAEMIAKLQSVVSLNPQHASAWSLLGQALLDSAPPARCKPNRRMARFTLTLALSDVESEGLATLKLAAEASQRSIELSSVSSGFSHCNLGAALVPLDPVAAIKVLQEGLRLISPLDSDMQYRLRVNLASALLGAQRINESIECSRSAVILSPRMKSARLALAQALEEKSNSQYDEGDFEGALLSLHSSLKASSDLAAARQQWRYHIHWPEGRHVAIASRI